jgi:hypothetical protein
VIEQEFVELMQDLITIEPRTAVDQYNNPTYGAAATYLAHVQPDAQEVRDMMGSTQISSAQIWAVPLAASFQGVTGAIQRKGQWYVVVPFTVTPKPPDRITLPDGTQPLILRSAVISDETGTPHHMKVYC